MTYYPHSTPENTIIFGNARFTLLTERMLRLEWAADGEFEDRATLAVVHRALPAVAYAKTVNGDTLLLSTAGFALEYSNDGRPFSARNLTVTFAMNDEAVTWQPGQRDRENLGATLRTLDGIKGGKRAEVKETSPGVHEPTGKWVPVDLGNGFISRSGWALIDDSDTVVVTADPEWVAPRPAGKRQDWYLLLHGHDYKGAVADAALVFGRQPLPPRFAFGYWWSRYWAYTDREIEDLVRQFDTHQVPLDVMVVDMDWHLEGWTGYTWDRRYFPNPDDFLSWLKARDLKITLNLHPAEGVAKFEEQFPEMAKAMGLNPKKIDRVPFDITDPNYIAAYFNILHHPQEEKGVDFWWMDWQQGKTTKMPGLDTLPWINHLHWRDMETNPRRANERPLIFSRFGGYGAGRYCVGFSGDTYSVWDSLQFQPHFTATAANVLYGYWSHDIGGHQPGAIDPELYSRWLQFGIFSPILRTHTTKNPTAERRVWANPDPYGEVMQDVIRRRYAMVPYTYTEARRCYDTGLSLCRPMYYEYPEENAAYHATDQYLFGDHLLVAPVLTPADEQDEMAEVAVWLPKGRWFDTARGCFENGNRTIRRRYLISEIPVFVRPGAIFPGQAASLRLKEGSYRDLVVTAYPGGDGEYRLYEDDGVSPEYQGSGYAWITLAQQDTGAVRTITVKEAEGSYRGFEKTRSLEVRLPGTVPPENVHVGGFALPWAYRLEGWGWSYDGDTATTIIRLPEIDIEQGVEVTVVKNAAVPESLAFGLQGILARLARVSYYNTIATSWLILHQKERIGIEAAQTGNRISRDPASFKAEVTQLRRLINALPTMLDELAATTNAWAPEPDPQRRIYCDKAIAILRRIRQEKM
ncbi:MAG: glycoside hydrolase family 31 protein [Armatimonadota bacterium]